jgi:hypothetical protein
MSVQSKSSLVKSLETAASKAGLVLLSTTAGTDYSGGPTTVFLLAVPGDEGRSLQLQLSDGFDFDNPTLLPAMEAHLADRTRALRFVRSLMGSDIPASLSGCAGRHLRANLGVQPL